MDFWMLKGPHTKDTIDTNNTFYFLPKMVFLHVTFTLSETTNIIQSWVKSLRCNKIGWVDGGWGIWLFCVYYFWIWKPSGVSSSLPLTESAEVKWNKNAPCEQNDWHTPVKTLPCPNLRAVINVLGNHRNSLTHKSVDKGKKTFGLLHI